MLFSYSFSEYNFHPATFCFKAMSSITVSVTRNKYFHQHVFLEPTHIRIDIAITAAAAITAAPPTAAPSKNHPPGPSDDKNAATALSVVVIATVIGPIITVKTIIVSAAPICTLIPDLDEPA